MKEMERFNDTLVIVCIPLAIGVPSSATVAIEILFSIFNLISKY